MPPRRFCRSICCGFRFSRFRSSPRSPSFCAQMLAFVALPFYLEDRFGYSAVEIGLLITPWPLAVAVAAPIAGRLAERYPAGLLGGVGLSGIRGRTGGSGVVAAAPRSSDIIWRMALVGAGFGLFQSPNNRTMIAAAPRERSGGASGMLGTARLLGQTTARPWWRCCWRVIRWRAPASPLWWVWASRWRARRSAPCGCRKSAPEAARQFAFWRLPERRVSEPRLVFAPAIRVMVPALLRGGFA